MNTYVKYCPNVYLAKCEEKHERGDVIDVTTKYGKDNESIVYNLIYERDGYYYYSIVRADGYNMQERVKRRSERYNDWAQSADRKSYEYFQRAEKESGFLSLGEPIKVGHHSEAGHRRMIRQAWDNTGKSVTFAEKADEYRRKADAWARHEGDINLSMPESVDYYAKMLKDNKEFHDGLKSGKYVRKHMLSLAYAKKAVNDAQKKCDLAEKLWGDK